MSTPNGRAGGRAGERPLVSVTGPAGFLFPPPRTDRKTQTRQNGAGERFVQKTGLVNDAHGIFQEGGRGPAPRSPPAPALSADLRPSYTQIIQQLLLIMPLSRNYVLAPLLSSAASAGGPLGRPVLLARPSLPAPPRHLEQSHLKFIRRLRFLCRWHSGSATGVELRKEALFRYANPGRASLKQCRKFSCCR